jgi:hypothetical protein
VETSVFIPHFFGISPGSSFLWRTHFHDVICILDLQKINWRLHWNHTWEEPFLNERFETYRLEKLDDNMQQESS